MDAKKETLAGHGEGSQTSEDAKTPDNQGSPGHDQEQAKISQKSQIQASTMSDAIARIEAANPEGCFMKVSNVAWALGTYVGSKQLDAAEVEEELFEAARNLNYGQNQEFLKSPKE